MRWLRPPTGDDPLGLRDVNVVLNAARRSTPRRSTTCATPGIIISASGMADRRTHVCITCSSGLRDHRTTILFVGLPGRSAPGDARLQEGASEDPAPRPATIRVRARVETIDGLSAHAGRGEIHRRGSARPGNSARS